MMLGVALHDVLDQWAVVGQKVRGNVDCLRVPDFAVFETILIGVQHS